MTSDRDLDARLAAAGGIRDEDLPALPDTFLHQLMDAGQAPTPTGPALGEPASVIASRQLVDDARRSRAGTGRRSSRRPIRRPALLLATAAVGATVLVVGVAQVGGSPTPGGSAAPTTAATDPATPTGPPEDLGPLEAPPGGLALAATDDISFPWSLEPEPADLTPVLGMYGGLTLFGYTEPVVWRAAYRAADDPGFEFRVSPGDPRILPPGASETVYAKTTESSVTVDGVAADLVLGDYDDPSCRYAPATPEQTDTPEELCAESFAQLTWQRPDGMWVQVSGEDDWSTAEAVVSIGESIVDRPQAVPLQLRLAPAGWSVSSYEDNRSLTLISDAAPTISNRISISLSERWRGEATVDLSEGETQGNPVEEVTVNGRSGRLASVPNALGFEDGSARMWLLTFELPNGLVVRLDAPETLTRDQVLQIAAQVTYDS